ncbi:CPBP family intramembrane glutamic endopeptidase [Streptococcus iners]|uniref:Type II CAAX endopeptidase family protein n=1 Tax=Streptococcus iners TaxID=3028084 RepID=A0AA96VIC5_9STRE|nr:type II CAAX endopeptidase family protein [Streptococcus sp. 29887]MCK4024623.1 CPBP family intramembrane metalloprotease [Streptococcus suis]WNY50380.1 type II CAAX endopeptidase family protein [Streptococcus sp. 29887]
MNRLGNVKDWNVVKNWKFLLVGLIVVALNVLTQMAMFALPNFDGANLLIAATLLLFAVVVGLVLTSKIGLWKSEQKWGMLKNIGFVVLAFIVMFGLKIIGGQLIMLEEGYGQTTANQEVINNSGLPALLLFLFAVLFAPVLEELIFRGILMGKVFGKDSNVGLLLSSFLFGLIHNPTNIGSWVVYGGMGLVLGLVYRISGNYSNALILHSLNNLLGFLLMLVMKSLGLI